MTKQQSMISTCIENTGYNVATPDDAQALVRSAQRDSAAYPEITPEWDRSRKCSSHQRHLQLEPTEASMSRGTALHGARLINTHRVGALVDAHTSAGLVSRGVFRRSGLSHAGLGLVDLTAAARSASAGTALPASRGRPSRPVAARQQLPIAKKSTMSPRTRTPAQAGQGPRTHPQPSPRRMDTRVVSMIITRYQSQWLDRKTTVTRAAPLVVVRRDRRRLRRKFSRPSRVAAARTVGDDDHSVAGRRVQAHHRARRVGLDRQRVEETPRRADLVVRQPLGDEDERLTLAE